MDCLFYSSIQTTEETNIKLNIHYTVLGIIYRKVDAGVIASPCFFLDPGGREIKAISSNTPQSDIIIFIYYILKTPPFLYYTLKLSML